MFTKKWFREHPEVPILWVGCVVAGVASSVWFLGDLWGLAGSVLAGVVGGAGSALILTANRLVGG